IYYCPSRRAPAIYSWKKNNIIDYAAVCPGQVPMQKNSNGQYVEDTIGLATGWVESSEWQNTGDWQYGSTHGVIGRGNNWPDNVVRHTFASVKDGTSNTMMIGEKFCLAQDYNGGFADDGGPFSGIDDEFSRTTSTPWATWMTARICTATRITSIDVNEPDDSQCRFTLTTAA